MVQTIDGQQLHTNLEAVVRGGVETYISPFALNKQGDKLIARSAAIVGLSMIDAQRQGGSLYDVPLDYVFQRNDDLSTNMNGNRPIDLWSAVFAVNNGHTFDSYKHTNQHNFQYHRRIKSLTLAYGVSIDGQSSPKYWMDRPNHWINNTAPILLPEKSSERSAMSDFNPFAVKDYGELLRNSDEYRENEVMYLVEAGSKGKRFLPDQVKHMYLELQKNGRKIKIMSDQNMVGDQIACPQEYLELIEEGLIEPEDIIFPQSTTEMAIHLYAADRRIMTDSFPKWLATGSISLRPDRPIVDDNGRVVYPKAEQGLERITDMMGTLQPGDIDVVYAQVSPDHWALNNEGVHYFKRSEYSDYGQDLKNEDIKDTLIPVLQNKYR